MSQTLTLRVGEEYVIDVAASVGGRNVGVARTVGSSDTSKVTVAQIDRFRYLLRAIATGTSTITAAVGGVNDELVVTVIAATAVTHVNIKLIGRST